MALSKHPFLYKAIGLAIERFGERHHITARQHLAPLLGFTGKNGSIQLGTSLNHTTYNPSSPHSLSIDQLAVLLDELGGDRHIILDALAREYGGVFHSNAPSASTHDDVRDQLIEIAGLTGDLSKRYLEFKNNDGVVDDLETEELENIAYEARKQLRSFEEMVAAGREKKE